MNVKQKKLGLLISTILGAQTAYALPQGAQVVHGQAAITAPNAQTLNINNTNKAIINWNQFNIGAGQTVNFHQPSASSSVLNNVISNTPSQLLGNLNSNGQVFLINQHGILVGEGARINTNGFFASTLKMTNEAFLKGDLTFKDGGFGGIQNKGYIHAGENGHVVFVAPNIENGGVVEVENGNVILAAGKSMTITSLDNAHIEFHVQSPEDRATNLGKIIAKNGAANLFAGTLKHSGSIKATKLVKDENGVIRLVASDSVTVNGSLDATSEQGQDIHVLGDKVTIAKDAVIDASGTEKAGEILIGGDQQGLNPDILNATSTTIEQGAQVHADGKQTGDGGRVIVFAKNDVHVHGEVTAKGGEQYGDGGFIETSGLEKLDIMAIPDATAPNGDGGEWLIDPNNITIIATSGNDDANYSDPGYGAYTYTSSTDATTLGADLIKTSLDNGVSVTIATGATGSELGDINVNSNIDVSASIPGNLTLNAHNDINLNADIKQSSSSSFNLTLTADSDGDSSGSVNFSATTIDTYSGNIAVSGNSANVTGASSIKNQSGTITLNAPLTINNGASLLLGSGSSSGSDLIVTGSAITNEGTLTINAGCGNTCGGSVLFNNAVTNNGTLAIDVGSAGFDGGLNNNGVIQFKAFNAGESANLAVGVYSPSVLAFNAGTTISDAQAGGLGIGPSGSLYVNTPTTLPSTMTLYLSKGTINNFENLVLPNTFNIAGGTINFNKNIYGIYDSDVYSMNISGASDLTINGTLPDTTFLYSGKINWTSSGGNLVLNNTDLNAVNFTIKNTSASAGISGTNGSVTILGGGRLEQNSGSNSPTTISTQLNLYGGSIVLGGDSTPLSTLIYSNFGQDLILSNGGALTGSGTFQGNVKVEAGGIIAPGVSGIGNGLTGLLNITGNVAFNADSNALFEIDANSTGLTGTFDQLAITGNVSFDQASNLHMFWSNVSGQTIVNGLPTLSLQTPLSLITWTGSVTGTGFGNVTDPLLVTSSTPSLITSQFTYLPVNPTVGQLVYWTGGAGNNDWEDVANWSTNLVPKEGQNLVVAASQIKINQATNAIGDSQFGGDVRVYGTGNLVSNGKLYALSNLSIENASSSISGSGTLYNFSQLDQFNGNNTGTGLLINVVNNGSLFFGEEVSTTQDFTFANASFANNGSILFLVNSIGNQIDFSAVPGGLLNNGKVTVMTKDTDVRYVGTLANNDEFSLVSVNNNNSKLTFANSNTNNGKLNLFNTSLGFDSGVSYTLGSGTSFNGGNLNGSILNVDSGVSLDLQAPISLVQNQNITLNGGSISNAQNLSFADTLTINGGSILGSGSIADNFKVVAGSTVSMTASLGDIAFDGLTVSNLGTMTFSSNNGDLNLDNGAQWVNESTGVINFNNNAGGADISSFLGTKGDFINKGVINSAQASGTDNIDIFIPFDNQGTLNIADGKIFEINDVSSSTGTINTNLSGIFKVGTSGSGVFNINAGHAFTGSGTFQVGSSSGSSNASVVNVNSSSNTFAPAMSLDLHKGGVINSIKSLQVPNTINWTGGTMQDSSGGTGIIDSGKTLNITGATGDMLLDGLKLSSGAGTFNFDIPTGRVFNISNGAILTFATPVNINGSGTLSVGGNSIFDVVAVSSMASGLTLELNPLGQIQNAQNLTIPNTFNWNGGDVLGSSGVFTIGTGKLLNYNLAQATAMTNLGFNIDGTLNVQSGNLGLSASNSVNGSLNIASGASVEVVKGTGNNLFLNSGSTLQVNGAINVKNLGSELYVADGVSPSNINVSTNAKVFFEGNSTVGTLNINAADVELAAFQNATPSVPPIVTVTNLNWNGGQISKASSAVQPSNAILKTTGTSLFTNGTLKQVNWLNDGTLNWQGTNLEQWTLTDANFVNGANATLNITNIAQTQLKSQFANKTLSVATATFVNNGTMNLDGATLNLGGLTLNLNQSTASLNGSGIINGDVVNNSGTISVGKPGVAGALNIVGDYTQGADGTLELRILDATTYDTFTVSKNLDGLKGTAKLDGTLSLKYANSGASLIPVSFTPIVFANREGTFSKLVDSNNNILAIDFSNGTFTIIGGGTSEDIAIVDVVKNQKFIEKIAEKVNEDEFDKTVKFIKQIIAEQKAAEDEKDDEKKKKKRGPKLVCK